MRGTLLRQGLALALVSLTPLSPALAAEDLPQPREIFDCSRNPPPTLDQVAWVALAFAAAWGCTAGDPVPFPVTDLNGYGCFCGSGSTGLDTAPVDAYDTCCQQHDIDWTALCRNVADPARPGSGCDCYVSVPLPIGCNNGVPQFANNLNTCQQACSRELVKQFSCYANAYAASGEGPDWTRHGNWCEWQHDPNMLPRLRLKLGPRRPFDKILPSYCGKSEFDPPPSDFGHYDPGPNVFKDGCPCQLNNANCTGTVYACTRSAAVCTAMGGQPAEGCGTPNAICEANVDVATPPCAYRDPNVPCPGQLPPVPAPSPRPLPARSPS